MIAAQRAFSCVETARCQPSVVNAPSHDAFTRLLTRQPPDTEALWAETGGPVNLNDGALALDDSTLDKPCAKRIELATRHWIGKHHRVVSGINLISMVWTDGEAVIPRDFRVYDKPIGGRNRNEHFRDMLDSAKTRGFRPEIVVLDSWYSSLENLTIGSPQTENRRPLVRGQNRHNSGICEMLLKQTLYIISSAEPQYSYGYGVGHEPGTCVSVCGYGSVAKF